MKAGNLVKGAAVLLAVALALAGALAACSTGSRRRPTILPPAAPAPAPVIRLLPRQAAAPPPQPALPR